MFKSSAYALCVSIGLGVLRFFFCVHVLHFVGHKIAFSEAKRDMGRRVG